MTEKIQTTVAEVMSPDVITIEATATVHDATELMRRNHTSSVVVNRRNPDDEYGLVVVSDIASNVLAKNLSPKRVNIYEIMSKPVISLPAEMNIVYAVRMLSRFGLSRGLVIDHDRNLLGIVTVRDMVLRNLGDIEGE
ncbi:MAG: CBS domain-containing protein [Rhodospirillales bacterium]|nr:CBS domain-containing protein [Rhodospirillales bacterium]